LRDRLVKAEVLPNRTPLYGATNQAFTSDEVLSSAQSRYTKQQSFIDAIDEVEPPPLAEDAIVTDERPEDERESWDSKITFLLATIG
jgi:hypothetical protein